MLNPKLLPNPRPPSNLMRKLKLGSKEWTALRRTSSTWSLRKATQAKTGTTSVSLTRWLKMYFSANYWLQLFCRLPKQTSLVHTQRVNLGISQKHLQHARPEANPPSDLLNPWKGIHRWRSIAGSRPEKIRRPANSVWTLWLWGWPLENFWNVEGDISESLSSSGVHG